MQSEMAGTADRVFRQLTDADLKFGMCKNEKGESVELSHSSFSSFLHSPEPQRPQESVPPVLRAVQGPREHARRRVLELGAARRLLRQGPRLHQRPRRLAVPRQRAGRRLRQPDRLRPRQPAGGLQVLRRPPQEDEAARHPPLRHLRADPQRPRHQAHLGAGGRRRRRVARTAGRRILPRARTTASPAAGATATRTRASRAAPSAPARSTASRTS